MLELQNLPSRKERVHGGAADAVKFVTRRPECRCTGGESRVKVRVFGKGRAIIVDFVIVFRVVEVDFVGFDTNNRA